MIDNFLGYISNMIWNTLWASYCLKNEVIVYLRRSFIFSIFFCLNVWRGDTTNCDHFSYRRRKCSRPSNRPKFSLLKFSSFCDISQFLTFFWSLKMFRFTEKSHLLIFCRFYNLIAVFYIKIYEHRCNIHNFFEKF